MTSSQSSVHKTFKEIKIHTAKCDQCNKHNSDTIYRCEDCSEQCCTPCWNQLGEDGDHLLNHALTVIIPADEMPKRKPKARKLGGSTKKAAKKANVTKSEKQPEEQQKDIIDVDDPNDVEIEKGFTAINSAKKTSRTAQKETSTVQSFARPDDDHNPSNSDPKISSNLHSKQTSRSTAHAAKSALRAPSTPKAPYGRSTTWNRGNNIVFKAGDAVRDGMPDMPANSNATAEVENGVLRITNANKRKRSDTAQEDQDPPDDHQASHAHKKACTSSGHGSEASMGSSPTRHEEEEHAQTLLLLAQGAQQSSPVPSPPTSNARSEPLSSHTRSSSSSFDDLPVWPPKPIPQHKPDTTSTRNRTFPAGHQHYEMAGVRQAQAHGRALAALALAPREGMVNRVWYPETPQPHTAANLAYQAGVNCDNPAPLNVSNPQAPITNANNPNLNDNNQNLDDSPNLNADQALQLRKAREAAADYAYQQAKREGMAMSGGAQVIEVSETKTKMGSVVETPLRKGMALVKRAASVS